MSTNLPGPAEPNQPVRPQEWPVAPAPRYFAEEEEAEGTHPLSRIFSTLLRQKWLVLLIATLGTIGGAIASRFVEPVYTTQATLWVETGENNRVDQGPITTPELLQSRAWIELLQSYTVLDHVVRQQRLYIEPENPEDLDAFSSFELAERFRPGEYQLNVDPTGRQFQLRSAEGVVVERGTVGSPVGEELGFRWSPSSSVLTRNRVIPFEIKNPRDMAVELGREIRPGMAQGNFLRLSLSGTDPQRLASTLNAVTERYVAVAGELKRAKLDELTAILEEQRQYAENNLHAAEMALENFQVNTITLPSEDAAAIAPGLAITRDPVFNSYFNLRIEAEQIQQDRQSIARVLEQLPEGQVSVEALSLIPSVTQSAALTEALQLRTSLQADLRALLREYTEEHPAVQEVSGNLENLEQNTIPRLASGLITELGARQGELQGRIGSASEELQQIPTRSIEEGRLERQVSIAENLHTTLKARYEEARLAAASSIPDIRVLDEAVVPYVPTSNSRTMVIFLGFVGSLGLAVLGVILMDRFDPRVRYPEQVTHEIGLPILSAIPFVKASGDRNDEHFAHAAEALRELRLSLLHAHGTAGPLTATVTSPESGDGKSFIASNLAVSFAEQGHRTLLIDGDIRKGTLHRLLGASRTPGLMDHLAKDVPLQDVIQETRIQGVYFIGAGTRMTNGPELLNSSAMAELMARVRSQFSVVIIDSSPLGAGVDPYVLSTMTRDMLLVLRTGTTNRAFAEAKLELMSRLPVRILGAVLNGTPDSQDYRYYSYISGYQVEEEPAPLPAGD